MSIIKPRTAEVPIYDGDDAQHLAELRQAAEVAKRVRDQRRAELDREKASAARLGDDYAEQSEALTEAEAELQRRRDAYDALVDAAAGRATIVRLQSIGRRRFRDLLVAHPARTVKAEDGAEQPHPDDAAAGVNTETLPSALLSYVDPDDPAARTVASPELPVDGLRSMLEDEIADGDFERLWLTAWALNRNPGTDPKVSRYSVAPLTSDET